MRSNTVKNQNNPADPPSGVHQLVLRPSLFFLHSCIYSINIVTVYKLFIQNVHYIVYCIHYKVYINNLGTNSPYTYSGPVSTIVFLWGFIRGVLFPRSWKPSPIHSPCPMLPKIFTNTNNKIIFFLVSISLFLSAIHQFFIPTFCLFPLFFPSYLTNFQKVLK